MELPKPLKKLVSTLKFEDFDKRSQTVLNGSYVPEDNLYTVFVETTCNGLTLAKYTEKLRFQARSFEDAVANKPSSTPEAIREISILLEDLFDTEGKYTGEETNKYGTSTYIYASKYDEDEYKLYNVVYHSPRESFYTIIQTTLSNIVDRIERTSSLAPVASSENLSNDNAQKIKWKGSHQQLGYLFDELDSSNIISLPRNHDGEGEVIHYPSVAQLALDHFDLRIVPKSKESLEKSMNPTSNKLADKKRDFIDSLVKAIYKLQES